MRKVLYWLAVVLCLAVVLTGLITCSRVTEVPNYFSPFDGNGNGKPDSLDIVEAARSEVTKGTRYDANYYEGGYPPEGRGACTDIIWIALRGAGIELKALIDEDIAEHTDDYPRVRSAPDPNIDFRRVPNLVVFFQKYGLELTTDVVPGDPENLIQWQPGDIVVWDGPEHIGIASDQRRTDGVPLVIHNCGPYASEDSALLTWPGEVAHHFRFPIWSFDEMTVCQ